MKPKKLQSGRMIKVIVVCASALLMCSRLHAQQYTVQETQRVGIKADSLEVAGLTMYIEFILKQDTKLYNDGTAIFKAERAVLSDKIKNGTAANTQLANFDALSVRAQLSHLDLYSSLYGDMLFKDPIVGETADDRKKKVTWKDQEYKLTSDSKSKFKELNADLESAEESLKREQESYNRLYK